jgi:hypothetical protein
VRENEEKGKRVSKGKGRNNGSMETSSRRRKKVIILFYFLNFFEFEIVFLLLP